VFNNDGGGKSMVNVLQLRGMLGDRRRLAPGNLLARFPRELAEFGTARPLQSDLFAAA
jgi:hypothetical protein